MTDSPIRLLVIANDAERLRIEKLLSAQREPAYAIRWVSTVAEAFAAIQDGVFDAVLVDSQLDNGETGLDLIRKAAADGKALPFIALIAQRDDALDQAALEAGASNTLIVGEFDASELSHVVRFALRQGQKLRHRALAEALRDSVAALASTLDLNETLDRIIAHMARVVPHDAIEIRLVKENTAVATRVACHLEEHAAEFTQHRPPLDLNESTLLRMLADSLTPVIISDIADFAAWKEYGGTSWVKSVLGAPLYVENNLLGFISLFSAQAGFFSEEHRDWLQAFADQSALAINIARRFEQAEILAVFQERQRLARELHDAVSQTLFAANVIAESLPLLHESRPDEVMNGLKDLLGLTRGALAEMRTLLVELRPASLLEIPLGELLRQLAQATSARKKIAFDIQIANDRLLPAEAQVAFYRVAQEALNNMVKHSRAANARIVFQGGEAQARLQIADDGHGFDTANVTSNQMGVGIMKERADAIGARLEVDSKPGSGTQITLEWQSQSAS